MCLFLFNSVALAALALALPARAATQAGVSETSELELASVFRRSEVAEIYIVRRDLSSPLGLRPHSVRQLGCQYFVHRSMPEWAELERAIAAASVRFEQAPAYGEMRVGLVFSDRAGTVLEVYSSDLPMPNGRVKGYIQRREVAISGRFPRALRNFAQAHRERVWVNPARPELCAAEETP